MPKLLACGSNGSGQLAIGHTEDTSTFTPCKFDASYPDSSLQIEKVVSAASHALLLGRNSQGAKVLLGAGTNTHNQLGLKCLLSGEEKPITAFRPFSLARDAGLEDWSPIDIAATWTTSFVVYERNGRYKIVAAGSNDFGELGTGSSGKPGVQEVTIDIHEDEKVELIRGGQRHVIVVLSNGQRQRIVGWGASRRGELDPTCTGVVSKKGKQAARPSVLPPTGIQLDLDSPIVDVALGAAHTLLLLENGDVMAWGNDAKGQITGLNDVHLNAKRIAATWGGSYLLSGRQLWSQGSNTHSQLLRSADSSDRQPVPLFANPISLVAGSEHVLLVTKDGTRSALQTGGWNEHGNLGLGDAVDRAQLVSVALDGSVCRVWGGCAASWVLMEDAE